MAGELYTLETLGDGKDILVLGGFHVALSPPPDFMEIEGRWGDWLTASQRDAVLDQVCGVGVGFGSCHTEFVLTPKGPRIIEINYRTVGDHMEFMLEHTLEMALFEKILRLHLGESLGKCSVAQRAALIRYFPTEKAGQILSAPEGFLYAGGGTRVEFRPLRSPGDRMTVTRSNKDYLGVLDASAPDEATLDRVVAQAQAQLSWDIVP